jgi:hypothetical protein
MVEKTGGVWKMNLNSRIQDKQITLSNERKITMKRALLVLLLVGIVLTAPSIGLAQTYQLQVANQTVSGSNFSFDIYLLRTGETALYLANADFVLTFNSGNFTSPTVSITSMDTQLETWYTLDASIVSTNRCIVNVLPPGVTSTAQLNARTLNVSTSGLGSLIARVQITGITTPSGMAGLAWRNTVPNATSLSSYNTSNFNMYSVTNVASHIDPDNTPLPVTLTSFNGTVNANQGGVVLTWKTASEVNNYGYTIQRQSGSESNFSDLAGAFVAGKGTTAEAQSYTYTDLSLTSAGTYTYRLKQTDLDGTVHYSQSVVVAVTLTDVAEVAPREFQLTQNYPNPFNPSTKVKFSVESSQHAIVKVYNMLGEDVVTLFDGQAEAGHYYVATFDASRLASGVYIYRITTDSKSDVKKMLLMK